ncbi:hypothetical protein POJ06DRAFT_238975 [Lipomyces tetrasporus]|uniref:Uncharacterized protein n=1 Tax=Lipomyces tetrasporus TaxID=54092 RepID=A0AAD7QPF0_9ASCO|nr:uncharacterized protein POJ06DRAFT_238975 [Lipomyces tetrasporus]KAJ8099064.1 hypothetical protein POJ06DRAFT_238975 [Lipomyces tetrasporus]
MSLKQRGTRPLTSVLQVEDLAQDDRDSENGVDNKSPCSASTDSIGHLLRIASVAPTSYHRQSYSRSATTRSQSQLLCLQFTRTLSTGSDMHSSPSLGSPTSTLMSPDIGDNLNETVLELVGEAVKGPEYVDKMINLDTVMLGQRIVSIRKLTGDIAGNWVLTVEALIEVVHTLFKRWRWRNDQPYDDAYANVVHTVLAVCLMRGICPWPEKTDREAIYSQLADLETYYYLRNTSTVLIRELVIAAHPHESTNFVRRVIDAAADKSQGFDHEALIRVLSTKSIFDSWIEKLVVIEEALRTPTDRFIDFVIDLISELTGISGRPDPDHKIGGNRIRDITTDIVDGTKLSGTGRKDALIMGLLRCLHSSLSKAYSSAGRTNLTKFSRVLLNRSIQADHVFALLDALDEPPKTDLTDIWPSPISEADIIGHDGLDLKPTPYEVLQEAVKTSNKKIVSDLRQLVTCPLLNDIGEDMVNVSCGHYFSRRMIEPWLAQTSQCPLCRRIGVTLQGPALWVDGVLDVIKGIEQQYRVSDSVKAKDDAKIVVGIYMSHAATVVGVKYDFMTEIVLVKDWSTDASFAIPSIVYLNDTADGIVGWGGGPAPSECRVQHIFSKPHSVTLISSFLSALSSKIMSYLNSGVAPTLQRHDNVKYLFCIPDTFCPGENSDNIFLRALDSAGWNLSAVEIVAETKCAAIFALDSNAGGIRRPNQVLHVLLWDYFGLSQRVYKLCPEDRFGIWQMNRSDGADHEVFILSEIESRIEKAIGIKAETQAQGSRFNSDGRQLILDAVQKQLAGRVYDDDLFECVPVSKAGPPRLMVGSGAPYFYDNRLHDDLMRTFFYAKTFSLPLDITPPTDSPAADLVPSNCLSEPESPAECVVDAAMPEILIDSEGRLTVSRFEVARCMNVAAMKALESVPRIMQSTSPSDRLSLVVFGPCADDAGLMQQLADWLNSDTFAKRRPEYTITVGNKKPSAWTSIADKGNAYDNAYIMGKSSSQIAIDGLWIACKMVMAGEA